MASRSEINNILNGIKTRKGDDLSIRFYDKSGSLDFSKDNIIKAANSKINKFIYEFTAYCDFINDEDLQKVYENSKEILNSLIALSQTPIENLENITFHSLNILEQISSLPEISDLSFVWNNHTSTPSLLNLFKLVNFEIQAFTETDINYVLKYANLSELEEISKILISIHNALDNSKVLAQEVVNAQKAFQSIIDKAYKLEVAVAVQDLEEKAVEIKEKVGLRSNDKLIDAFIREANLHVKEISDYNKLILTLFSIIIFTLSSLVILTLTTNIFNEIKKIQFYGFYISLFLFLTALLTYLIRERKRLINHQHYCTISHLELLALAPYVAQIDDKNKQDDLIVLLGDRYFKGPNPSQNNDEATSNITTSKLSEVIKLVQEVKTTLK